MELERGTKKGGESGHREPEVHGIRSSCADIKGKREG